MEPEKIVHIDPEILGGTPVFVGTRVPVDALIDFLEGGDTIEDFLENYPGVSREHAIAFLEEASAARSARSGPQSTALCEAKSFTSSLRNNRE